MQPANDSRANGLGSVKTATLVGVIARLVTVEVSFTNGLPGINIVGMPDTAVNESRLRVRAALRASGYDVPAVNLLINLAPSDIPKSGSAFDLPIALGILLATGQIVQETITGCLCVGELSLDGSIKPVRGMLAYEQLSQELGIGMLSGIVERGVLKESCERHWCIEKLSDFGTGEFKEPLPRIRARAKASKDYADIAGNELAKRALTLAAIGKHSLMMIGPPGSGKTMMASRLPTIMPSLEDEELSSAAMIHSVAGLPYDNILDGQRPFRAPHHSATKAGLMGGGSPVLPGEVSLAHNGILFLDEISEFGAPVLQMLRQPIENGFVALARARGTTILPSSFMLLAASNPCPCGYLGDPERSCSCSEAEVRRYQARIGGPLLDRIDMMLDVWRSKPGEVLATGTGKSSHEMRREVGQALAFRNRRIQSQEPVDEAQSQQIPLGTEQVIFSGEGVRLLAECALGKPEQLCLEQAAERLNLSGRGIMRALSVARTIADLEHAEYVCSDHILEALTFRADGRFGDGNN